MNRNSIAFALALASVALAAGCSSSDADGSFVKQELTLALNGPLVGTAKTDLWSVTTVTSAGAATPTVVHTRDGARWDAVPLPELSLDQGAQVNGLVASGKGEIWLSSTKAGAPVLARVTVAGGFEDHSNELSPGTASGHAPGLFFAAGTLFVTQAIATGPASPPFGEPYETHVYRRGAGGLEELPGLPTALEYGILAVRGPDELYLWRNPPDLKPSTALHYQAGTVTEIPWPNVQDGPPTVEVSSAGESWFWDTRHSTSESLTGLHGRGAALSPWASQGWPAQTADFPLTQRAFQLFPVAEGKVAFLVTRTHFAAQEESEKVSVGVNHMDAQGVVTEGPTLYRCVVPEECSVGMGEARRFDDGTVIIPGGSEGKMWITGSAAELE